MFEVNENYTRVSEFVIVGFPGLHPSFFQLVAWFFFCVYLITVVGNFLLVVMFALERSLQKPMYIIMLSLALSDIGKMLSLALSDIGNILSLALSDIGNILSLKVAFCGPNRILHAYCDAIALTRLSCSNMVAINDSSYGLAMFVLLVPLSLIIFSYVSIIVTVMRMANAQGRRKTFSTCGTQGCLILIYYIPRFIVYSTPYMPNLTITPDFRVGLSLICSLFPPVANPFIYCFRTKEIRTILGRWRQRWGNSRTEPRKPNTVAVITR
ncbi:olfactory receptor 10A4-like [Salvelinus sp. IW2-2015]|uniref:olfactory receptor 10A4-like n=1 Tax=Salvelinus sp. IW2-2015 TaxID=2691554 RepID=UPI0038D35F85